MTYSDEFKAAAVRLAGEVGNREAEKRLGVCHATLYRWTNPDYAAHDREVSREAKHRRKQPCPRCGTLMSYDRTERCEACYRKDIATDHGQPGMYKRGCRCDACREGNRNRKGDWRASHGPVPVHVHGSHNGYSNWGCRCDACRNAASEQNRKQREKRLAACDL